jgi:hypothetical protein
LNENLVPAGHFLYDESQAHLLTIPIRIANTVNLSYVTARVSHWPHPQGARPARTPPSTFLFLPI